MSMEVERRANNVPLPSNSSSATSSVSQRLSKVLSTSFADSDITAALNLLDASSRASAVPLNLREDLRHRVRLQALEVNKTILGDFARLGREMKVIKGNIEHMKGSTTEMRHQASTIASYSSQLIEQSTVLKERRARVETKRSVLQVFKDKFFLSTEELAVLESSEGLNLAFFQVLDRVRHIHRECQMLLISDTQKAGKEIMSLMAKYLETGFEKLHRWLLQLLKNSASAPLNGLNGGGMEHDSIIRRALSVLSERQELFETTLAAVSESRQKIISRDFVYALSSASQHGGRALELSSFDAMRFVGDLLAWLHQTIASEKEVLELMLGSPEHSDQKTTSHSTTTLSPPQASDYAENFDFRKIQNQLVDRNLTLVLRDLQQRIEDVTRSTEDQMILFKAAILIRFYRSILKKVLEPDAVVLASLKGMETAVLLLFSQRLDDALTSVKQDDPDIDSCAELPAFLMDFIYNLEKVQQILATSFLSTEEQAEEFTNLFEQVLFQYSNICKHMASKCLNLVEGQCFMLNCLQRLFEVLKGHTFCSKQSQIIESDIIEYRNALVKMQLEFARTLSGLLPQLNAIASEPRGPYTKFPEFNAPLLNQAANQLESFLETGLLTTATHLDSLQFRKTAAEINETALQLFVNDFKQIESIVIGDEDNAGVEFGRTLFPRTADEVRIILGLA